MMESNENSMIKNYFNIPKNCNTALKSIHQFRLILLVVLTFLGSNRISAQVAITTPNLVIPVCSGFPSGYAVLGDIIISETTNNDFSIGAARTLVFTCPANFQFLAGTGTIAITGGRNLSATSIVVTATTMTITYTCGGFNRSDDMTISGIQIRAINTASTGNITRTSGTGTVSNLTNGTNLTNTITSTVGVYPTISSQPVSDTACTNETVTFSVTASGVTTYQWQRNGVNIVNGGIYSGATTNTLTITNPTVAENGASYTVVLNGATCPVTSNPAIITVNSLPTNPGNPTSNSPQCTTPGVTITKSGSPSGGITWYWQTTALGTATTNNANTPYVVTTSGTYYIRAQNNTTGCWSLGAGSITVTVNAIPVISVQPFADSACTNDTVTFSVTASGVTTYQWKKNGVNITNGGIYTGATTSTLTITNPTVAENGASYTVVLNNATCPVTSSAAIITVNALPANPGNPTSNSPQCTASGVTITKTGSPAGGITWYWQATALGTATTNNANTPYIVTTSGTYYIRAQNNTTGCWSLGSGSITVTVNAIPVISLQPISASTCTNGTLTFTVTASGVTTYQWKKNGVNIVNGGIYSGATTTTLTITNPTVAENGASYTIVLNNTTCPVTSSAAIITVNAAPAAPTLVTPSTGITICNGSSTNLNATSAGNTINWYTVAVGGSSIGTSASGINFSVAPTSNTTYYAEAQNASGCKSTTRTATALITVTTITPVIEFTQGLNDHTYTTSASSCGTIIGGGQNDLDIFSGNPGGSATFQWQVSYDNGGIWVNGPGPSSTATQYILDPLYTIYESVAGNYYFRLLITNNGCTGISNSIVLTVTGTSSLTPGVIGSNQVFCTATGDPAAFTATAPTGGSGTYSYQWQSSTDNVTFTDIAGATAATYNSPLLSQTTYFRRIVASNGCRGVSNTITVFIGLPTITTSPNANSVCFNSSSQTTPLPYSATTGSPTTYSITWNAAPANSFAAVTNVALPVSQITITVPANTAVGTYTGTITVKNANGCVSTGTTFTVTVNPIPLTPTITAGGPTTFCAGGSVTLTSSAGTSYLWSTGATTQSISAVASGSYTVQIKNASGCQSAASIATVVTVNALPATPTISAGGPIAFCIGGSVTLTSSVGTGYLWSTGATSQSINVTTSGNYTVRITNALGCQSASSAITSVTVNALPAIPSISASSPTTLCAGSSVLLTASPEASYLWSTGDTTASITVATAGSYTVTVFNASGCQSPSSLVTVVTQNIVTAATVAGNQSLECEDLDPEDFTIVTPASGSGVLSYQWQSNTSGCGGAWSDILGANSATYDPPAIVQTTYYHLVTTSTLNGVACSAVSNCIVVSIMSKTWTGIIDSDWSNDSNWSSNGVPTASDCVIIPNAINPPIISGSSYNAQIYSLTILNGGLLTVTSGNSITVTDFVTVISGGQFLIKDGASLVQVNNVSNTGTLNMERITQPMYRFDYTYWGCPVTLASNFTLGNLSPNTLSDKYFSWTPTIGNSFGNWFYESAATVMNPIKGYIVRAPQTFSSSSSVKVPYTANFIGTPNNGDISCPIYHGTLGVGNNNDKYNLLGNPYPSAVDAQLFLSDPSNTPIIDGTIYFWTHNSAPSASYVDPFYGDFVINYSSSDYASWNSLGAVGFRGSAAASGGSAPDGYIAAGQGFFTKSTGTAPSGDSVVFKNSMRVSGTNNQFFRSSASSLPTRNRLNPTEKHRIWLNLINNTGIFNQILVGYAENATVGWDRDFDGVSISENSGTTFYSIIQDKNLVIQGRGLPFSDADEVPLGYKSSAQDTFAIRIDHFDGLFENQNISIEDKVLHIIHDLKQSPYLFASSSGTFNDRFVLRYTNTTLSTQNPNANIGVISVITNEKLVVQASEKMRQIEVFDLTGKLIQKHILTERLPNFETNFIFADGIYMVKIHFESGHVVTQKLINKK